MSEEKRLCEFCHGSGEYNPFICPHCHGSGYNEVWNKWITPLKYRQLTGKDWPDDGPVWRLAGFLGISIWVLQLYQRESHLPGDVYIIANEHGKPHADFIPED